MQLKEAMHFVNEDETLSYLVISYFLLITFKLNDTVRSSFTVSTRISFNLINIDIFPCRIGLDINSITIHRMPTCRHLTTVSSVSYRLAHVSP